MSASDVPQHEIELILLRQVASYLATPIFLVDLEGNLLYYNEPAEPILGRRYEETGEMPTPDLLSHSLNHPCRPMSSGAKGIFGCTLRPDRNCPVAG